jgi:2-dehydro-3-deoxy-D-arabinonate dehydratase
MAGLVRFTIPEKGNRLGCLIENSVYDITPQASSLSEWMKTSPGRVVELIQETIDYAKNAGISYPFSSLEISPDPDAPRLLAPIDRQEVWAAGVTYERSRTARQEEAIDGGDIYARVYSAERPELFYKDAGQDVIGPNGQVGIRHDAVWSVPEPELAVLLNPYLQVVGFSIGNDLSSRDIEGANPLYLPQAKVYTASCALGPQVLLHPATEWPEFTINMRVYRQNNLIFFGSTGTDRIKRPLADLIDYLGRCRNFPEGVFLLTGTGIVPPSEFSLQEGDAIDITIEGIGRLFNTVKVV